MEEELNNKGPHRVLIQEDTLDYILSFLHDGNFHLFREKKPFLQSARLVCQKWNDRILANFHKRLSIKFVKDDSTIRVGPSFLTSCDPRILSSVSMINMSQPDEYAGWMMESVLELLRLSGRIEGVRILKDLSLDERMFDYIISVANQGFLVRLEELRFSVTFNHEEDQYQCMNFAYPGALSEVRSLDITFVIYSACQNEVERLNSGNLPSAIQSLVTAAPNLQSLTTNVLLDLSGKRLRWLKIGDCVNPEILKAMGVFESVKDSLTNLSLEGSFPDIPFPAMPNLVSLDYSGNEDMVSYKINLKAFPALSRMKIDFNAVNWGQLPSLLPPVGQLRRLELDSVKWPETEDLTTLLEPFRILMNSGLSLLTLFFRLGRKPRISQLKELLQLVNMDENVERNGRKKSVLELYFVEDDVEGCKLENFTFFLEKLGRHWDLVLFHGFKFNVKQPKEVMEASLIGGTKNGRIKISAYKKCGFKNGKSKTVSLERIVSGQFVKLRCFEYARLSIWK